MNFHQYQMTTSKMMTSNIKDLTDLKMNGLSYDGLKPHVQNTSISTPSTLNFGRLLGRANMT
eukprot:6255879-Amphidinium_carterae.2